MDPITAVTSILANIKTATDIAKLIKDADFSLEKAELKLKLAEMIGALADAKIEIAEVQSLILQEDGTIKELTDKLALQGEMRYEPPFYWRIHDGKRDGPFCQKCYDSEAKIIRLQQRRGSDAWDCLQCHGYFTGPRYAPPSDPDEPYDPLNWGRR